MQKEGNIYAPPIAQVAAEPVITESPKLWNPDAAGVWSVLLTPVFGSFLVLKNWQAIGDAEKVKSGRTWLIVSVIVVFLSSIGRIVDIAYLSLLGRAGSVAYIIIWYFVWQRKQTRYVKERWGSDYQRKGWFFPVLAGIGLLAVFSALAYMAHVAAA